MNNPHTALIEEKVAEFKEISQTYIKCGWDETNNLAFKQFEVNWTEQQVDWLRQTLQDTIDTVLKEERERTLEILTTTINANQMLRGWERYWKEVEPNRFVENCIECENTSRILKALDKTPPNKV